MQKGVSFLHVISHLVPEYPGTQLQTKTLVKGRQEPPFRQGLELQGTAERMKTRLRDWTWVILVITYTSVFLLHLLYFFIDAFLLIWLWAFRSKMVLHIFKNIFYFTSHYNKWNQTINSQVNNHCFKINVPCFEIQMKCTRNEIVSRKLTYMSGMLCR